MLNTVQLHQLGTYRTGSSLQILFVAVQSLPNVCTVTKGSYAVGATSKAHVGRWTCCFKCGRDSQQLVCDMTVCALKLVYLAFVPFQDKLLHRWVLPACPQASSKGRGPLACALGAL